MKCPKPRFRQMSKRRALETITRLLRLRYLSAGTRARNLKPFLPSGATIVQDTVTNSITIMHTQDNIAKVAGIPGTLDMPYFSDISWRLFPYRSTGIILMVTPHINSSGLGKMEVSQEVSDKSEFNTALSNYTFLNRKAKTTLEAEDGQTIVIGGLMKTIKSVSQAGIPWLRKIPILAYLFGRDGKEATAKPPSKGQSNERAWLDTVRGRCIAILIR